MKTLGSRIRHVRQNIISTRKLTQQQLADELGVAPQFAIGSVGRFPVAPRLEAGHVYFER